MNAAYDLILFKILKIKNIIPNIFHGNFKSVNLNVAGCMEK